MVLKLNMEFIPGNGGTNSPTLVFVHGNSQNLQFWSNQLHDPIFDSFDRAAIDLPGHGKSSRLANYHLSSLNAIISENLNVFGSIIIVAHSLGGHLILQSLTKIHNCIGLMLIGTPPLKKPLNMEEAFIADERMNLLFKEDLSRSEKEELIKYTGCEGEHSTANIALERADKKFRSHIANEIGANQLLNEFEIFQTCNFPKALVLGEFDQLVNKSYLDNMSFSSLWNNKVQNVSNTGHTPHLESPNVFNTILSSFIGAI